MSRRSKTQGRLRIVTSGSAPEPDCGEDRPTPSNLDTKLVALRLRALEGDLDGARDLVLAFSPYARAVLGNCRLIPTEIDDCSQELWGKVFDDDMKVLRAWRGEGSLRAYLAIITRRLALDMQRRRQADRAVLGADYDLALEGEAADPNSGSVEGYVDPQLRCEQAEGRRLVKRGLSTLSPRYRQVLVLRYFFDRKHREIGESMQIPTSQVGIVLQRAENALAKVLAELAADPCKN